MASTLQGRSKENLTHEKDIMPLDWLVYVKNPIDLWNDNWFALVLEIISVIGFIICWRHASKRDCRSLFFLISCFFGCFGGELLQQIPFAGYQLWWYHQGTINFMGHRMPLYVALSVAVFFYTVDFVMRRMQFPTLTRSFINAMVGFAAFFPCLCLAPNLLLVIVHFDDPVFHDRLLNVPYTQMTYLFLIFFHLGHLFNKSFDAIEEEDKHSYGYIKCAISSGLMSGIYAIVEVYLLHMFVKNLVNLSIPMIAPLAVIILLYLARQEMKQNKVESLDMSGLKRTFRTKEFVIISAFLLLMLCIADVVHPEDLKSNSERVEWGPCDVLQSVVNTSPLAFPRRRYICPNDTANVSFDFHCLPPSQLISSEVKKQYTLCGTSFNSYLLRILSWYSLAIWAVLYLLLSVTVKSTSRSGEHFGNLKKVD